MTTVYNDIHNVLKRINYKPRIFHVEKARYYNIDDWVLLARQNLPVNARNNNSLTCKQLGPYKVTQEIGSHAYQLEIPEGTQ